MAINGIKELDGEQVVKQVALGGGRYALLVRAKYADYRPIDGDISDGVIVHKVGEPGSPLANGGELNGKLDDYEERFRDVVEDDEDMARRLVEQSRIHGWYAIAARSEEGNLYVVAESPERVDNQAGVVTTANDWVAWCNGEQYDTVYIKADADGLDVTGRTAAYCYNAPTARLLADFDGYAADYADDFED